MSTASNIINSSYCAGKMGEIELLNLLKKNNFNFTKTSHKNHSGDVIVYIKNLKLCLDVKNNYLSKNIKKKTDILKLKSDIDTLGCDSGILVYCNTDDILEIYSNYIIVSLNKLVYLLLKIRENI